MTELVEKPFDLIGLEDPKWVETQRLRRLHACLLVYRHTRSGFLLEWAELELMHIIRDGM